MTPSSSLSSTSLTRKSHSNAEDTSDDYLSPNSDNLTEVVSDSSLTLNPILDCVHEKNGLRVTDAGYMELHRRHQAQYKVDLKFSKLDRRMQTFNNDLHYLPVAKAGFYRKDSVLACFCCPFELRMEAFINPSAPLQDHTRWSPFCPFVSRWENEDVRRAIKQEVATTEQRPDVTGIHPWRRTTLELNMLIEISDAGYENSDIKEAVVRFFMRTGAYPNVESLRRELKKESG
ncbi:uncharacterized protein LOC132549312 [Ylistrum balloti]|uniref:uncharacterized protein LOC132549312 n=1 Tax=Ylistrum balloti TaxID=509963 RepID=UPI00290590ED|nr:uncharacterized protein LOC132549312 [Ylistrum balloti]